MTYDIIDLTDYTRMGAQRGDFDEWLAAEGLKDKLIYRLEIHEGYVLADHFVTDSTGKITVSDDAPDSTQSTFTIGSQPPAHVLNRVRMARTASRAEAQ